MCGYEYITSICWCVICAWQEAMRRIYMHDKGACHFRVPVPVREAIETWLSVEDDLQVLDGEVEL